MFDWRSSWLRWQWWRAQFSLQYTVFTQFNGSYGNYDGFQRNGLANSTLYLLMAGHLTASQRAEPDGPALFSG